jgi:hypothetical protein
MSKHDYLLQFFTYKHLPPHLQEVSRPFGDLARQLVDTLPSNPERSTALRKLLEAKDCAVRALLWKTLDLQLPENIAKAIEIRESYVKGRGPIEGVEEIYDLAFAEARERGDIV